MRAGELISVRKSSITQWLNLLLYLRGEGLVITSVHLKCMADALSKQRYVGLACGTWCFPCLGARIFQSLCYQSINPDFLMGTGRRGIALKSTPQSFSLLLSRNSENGFRLWGKNTLFQFPLVFLPWDSQFPSILTSWDPDKWAEKIIHSNHILTNSLCTQRCLERAGRKWPSRAGFWPLVLWVACEVHSLALALHGDHEPQELRPALFVTVGDEIQRFPSEANVPSVTQAMPRVSKARSITMNSSSGAGRAKGNLQLGTWSGKQRSLKLLISLAEILKSNMNFWAETNQHKEKNLKDHPLISGLNWSTLGKPKSVCKTQMVYLWKEIITRTFQMVWSELSWEIQAVCNTVPLAGHDFHYKWHVGAGFPGCTKFGESDELHTSVVVALDPTAQSL